MKRFLLIPLAVLLMVVSSSCQMATNLLPTQTPYPTYTPNPTYTPIPTFTPYPTLTPTLTPIADPILFEESSFNGGDENCFPDYSSPEVQEFSKDGQFHIVVQEKNYFGWSTCDTELRNFVMEVDATPIEGPSSDNYAYGVFFRRSSVSDGYYAFLISANGYYTFSGVYPDDYFPLLAWTPIREIAQGTKTNHLKVVAVGDQFEG